MEQKRDPTLGAESGGRPVSGWRRVWAFLNTPLGATVAGGLLVAVVVAVFLETGNQQTPGPGGSPGVSEIQPPANATEEAAQRSFWSQPPQVFEGAEGTLSYPGDGNGPYIGEVAAVELGDVVALTPRELVEDGARYAGLPVFLVGQVAGQQARRSEFIDRELRLVGREPGFEAYVATDDIAALETGDRVYALGRIAAAGEATTTTGTRGQAAYFLSLLNENGGTVELGLLQPGSGAIARALRKVRRKR